jgi:hypothetical protein
VKTTNKVKEIYDKWIKKLDELPDFSFKSIKKRKENNSHSYPVRGMREVQIASSKVTRQMFN